MAAACRRINMEKKILLCDLQCSVALFSRKGRTVEGKSKFPLLVGYDAEPFNVARLEDIETLSVIRLHKLSYGDRSIFPSVFSIQRDREIGKNQIGFIDCR